MGAEAAAGEALRRGDFERARGLYDQILKSGRPTTSACVGLALAFKGMGDSQGFVAAIDRAIAIEPRNVQAHLLKADHFSSTGNGRAASSFYSSALRHAASLGRVPPELAQDLSRAKAMLERYARNYEDHLTNSLASRGINSAQASARFRQSLDLVLGKKRVYLQEPTQFYFPELPQIQFYDRSRFAWVSSIEAATADIRNELVDVLKEEGVFTPYVEPIPDRPPPEDASMVGNPNWGAYFLLKNGELVADHAARCPKTLKAIEAAPLCRIAKRAPSVFFSLLKPGTRIPPHTGYINTRLICHLPLIVPEKCMFRVGNDVRQWIPGEMLLFDDTIEHEARNDSAHTRVVLIFDIWRPELSADECNQVAATLEAIDRYGSASAS